MVLPEIDTYGPTSSKLIIGDRCWHMSYQTVIAYSGQGVRIRRDSNYSNTTARHFRSLGSLGWDKVPDAEFERIASVEG